MFKPGHVKTGGRKKGVQNKASMKMLEQFIAKGINPVDKILALIESEKIHEAKKLDAWVKMLAYCYPTLKAIELSTEDDKPIAVTEANVAMLWQIARNQALAATKEKDVG